jgi:hypothetical protein
VLAFTYRVEISLNCFQRLLENNLRQAGTAESSTFGGASPNPNRPMNRANKNPADGKIMNSKRERSSPRLIYFDHCEKDGAVWRCKGSQKRHARRGHWRG